MVKKRTIDPHFNARVKKVAGIVGVSERHVRYIIEGKRKNEVVFTCYMTLLENETETEKALLKEVIRIKPFAD
jgi:hypothetical protein